MGNAVSPVTLALLALPSPLLITFIHPELLQPNRIQIAQTLCLDLTGAAAAPLLFPPSLFSSFFYRLSASYSNPVSIHVAAAP